jgi:hypothetical protein
VLVLHPGPVLVLPVVRHQSPVHVLLVVLRQSPALCAGPGPVLVRPAVALLFLVFKYHLDKFQLKIKY